METVREGMVVECLDNIYKVTAQTEDYINPIADGNLSWHSIISCSSDSDEGLENWKQRLHEVSTRRCVRITKSLCWIGREICELPHYDGLIDVMTFFVEFEHVLVEHKRLLALYVALKATPTRWWVTHKIFIQDWSQCRRLMHIRLGETSEYIADKYTGIKILKDHIVTCGYVWN